MIITSVVVPSLVSMLGFSPQYMSSTAKYAPYAYAPSIKMERTLSPDGATQASALARMIEKEATSVAAMIISQQRDIEPEVGAVFARGLGDYYSRGFPE